MRRILLVLTAAALMAAMLVVLQAPAMAQSFRFNNGFNNGFNDGFNDGFFDHNHNFNNGFDNGFEQRTGDTGDVNLSTQVSGSGNNSNQCVAPLQFGNTGSSQNAQGFSTFGSPSRNGFNNGFDNGFFNNGFDNGLFNNGFGNLGDVEFGGSSFEFNPQQSVGCNQQVQQSAAASN